MSYKRSEYNYANQNQVHKAKEGVSFGILKEEGNQTLLLSYQH